MRLVPGFFWTRQLASKEMQEVRKDINTVTVIKEEVACQDLEHSQPKYVKYKYSIF